MKFSAFSGKFMTGLSKGHSKCPKYHFEEKIETERNMSSDAL